MNVSCHPLQLSDAQIFQDFSLFLQLFKNLLLNVEIVLAELSKPIEKISEKIHEQLLAAQKIAVRYQKLSQEDSDCQMYRLGSYSTVQRFINRLVECICSAKYHLRHPKQASAHCIQLPLVSQYLKMLQQIERLINLGQKQKDVGKVMCMICVVMTKTIKSHPTYKSSLYSFNVQNQDHLNQQKELPLKLHQESKEILTAGMILAELQRKFNMLKCMDIDFNSFKAIFQSARIDKTAFEMAAHERNCEIIKQMNKYQQLYNYHKRKNLRKDKNNRSRQDEECLTEKNQEGPKNQYRMQVQSSAHVEHTQLSSNNPILKPQYSVSKTKSIIPRNYQNQSSLSKSKNQTRNTAKANVKSSFNQIDSFTIKEEELRDFQTNIKSPSAVVSRPYKKLTDSSENCGDIDSSNANKVEFKLNNILLTLNKKSVNQYRRDVCSNSTKNMHNSTHEQKNLTPHQQKKDSKNTCREENIAQKNQNFEDSNYQRLKEQLKIKKILNSMNGPTVVIKSSTVRYFEAGCSGIANHKKNLLSLNGRMHESKIKIMRTDHNNDNENRKHLPI